MDNLKTKRLNTNSVIFDTKLGRRNRLWYKPHNFDKYEIEYICVNPKSDYSDYPKALRIKRNPHAYKGGDCNFMERTKYFNPWLEEQDLDLLCKQLAQMIIRERGSQGFITMVSVRLYNDQTKKTYALKRYFYD